MKDGETCRVLKSFQIKLLNLLTLIVYGTMVLGDFHILFSYTIIYYILFVYCYANAVINHLLII